MTKLNLPNSNSGGVNNLVSEYLQFDYLFKLNPRSTSGNIVFTSATSGITYDSSNYNGGIYSSLGQEGMLMVLQDALKSYLITADDYNGINTSITNHIATASTETVSGHVELATVTETTAGTDNTRAVHPLGLKSATNLLIPLSQKGVASGVGSLDSSGHPVEKSFISGSYTGDGSASRLINLGFTPSAVLIFPTGGIWHINSYYSDSGLAVQNSPAGSVAADDSLFHFLVAVTTGGFYVGYHSWYVSTTWSISNNSTGNTYNYIAFR